MIYLGIPLTLALYFLTKKMYVFKRLPFINPVLMPCLVIIPLILYTGYTLDDYQQGTMPLRWMLEPSIVALAIPLYLQFKEIKKQAVSILVCCFISAIISITSAVLICHFLGVDHKIACSLAARSVTTPLAISTADQTGGIATIAVAVVCIVGIGGSIIGFPLLKAFKITDPKAQGLAIGACSHAVGTSAAQEHGVVQGSYSSLALVLCGIITSLIAPGYISFLYKILN